MIRLDRRWRWLACWPLPLVAACSGSIGDGRAPTEILVHLGGESSTATVVECTATQLSAALLFDDGTSSDVASRVSWESSDETVAAISNADLLNGPGTSLYAAGVLVARRPGTATISAHFLDENLIDTFDVEVRELTTLTLDPALQRMAPESSRRFELEGYTASGYPVAGLGSETVWLFPDVSAPADVSTSGTTAVVTALEGPTDTPFELEARLPGCGRHAAQTLQIDRPLSVRVATRQPVDAPLPLGVSESLQLIADFADGSTQNLTLLAGIEQLEGASGDATLTVHGNHAPDDRVLLTPADADETVQYELCYDPLDACATSPLFTIAELDATTLAISPQTLTLVYPQTARLRVSALFEDGIERDVTDSVSWSNDAPMAVTVTTEGAAIGEIASQNVDLDALIDISATRLTDDVEQASVRVYSIEP